MRRPKAPTWEQAPRQILGDASQRYRAASELTNPPLLRCATGSDRRRTLASEPRPRANAPRREFRLDRIPVAAVYHRNSRWHLSSDDLGSRHLWRYRAARPLAWRNWRSALRSEERRVGKERRSRWSPYN